MGKRRPRQERDKTDWYKQDWIREYYDQLEPDQQHEFLYNSTAKSLAEAVGAFSARSITHNDIEKFRRDNRELKTEVTRHRVSAIGTFDVTHINKVRELAEEIGGLDYLQQLLEVIYEIRSMKL